MQWQVLWRLLKKKYFWLVGGECVVFHDCQLLRAEMHVCYLKWSSLSFFVDWLSTDPRGGLLYETDGDANRLA